VAKKKIVDEIPDEMLPVGHGRDELLRLYKWTFADATRAQDEADETVGPYYHVERWMAAQDLRKAHAYYKDGHKQAVIEALSFCLLYSLPIPAWCKYAFLEACDQVSNYEHKSWDDVFGRPHPKRTRLDSQRKMDDLGGRIYFRVQRMKTENPQTPIGRLLFEELEEEFGLKGGTAEKYYRAWKKIYGK
jgi:hypothetical protein